MKLPVFIILFFFSAVLAAQTPIKQLFGEAEEMIENGRFADAAERYEQMLAMQPDNAHYSFKLAYLYFQIPDRKEDAFSLLLKAESSVSLEFSNAYNDTVAPPETWLFIAEYYHRNNAFDIAESYYTKYRDVLSDKEELERINRRIDECVFGNEQLMVPKDLIVFDLGSTVGSKYDDHSPVVSSDGNTLIFTSKREGVSSVKGPLGDYSEDLYVSKKVNGRWQTPVNMGTTINSAQHEASAGLSGDGTRLYLYKDIHNGDIYMSKFDGTKWSEAEALEGKVNTRSRETHISVSRDENLLYFSSNRSGGVGGSDIYVSERLGNGTWSKGKNLGEVINTPFDEEGAFISNDGKKLYFSSNGHLGMGGYDLFRSELDDNGVWSEPVNLGFPANSSGDDVFYYTPTDDENVAYYVSNHYGTSGSLNIYSIITPEEYERIKDNIEGTVWYPTEQDKQQNANVLVFVYKRSFLSAQERHYLNSYLAGLRIDTTNITLEPTATDFGLLNPLKFSVNQSKDPDLFGLMCMADLHPIYTRPGSLCLHHIFEAGKTEIPLLTEIFPADEYEETESRIAFNFTQQRRTVDFDKEAEYKIEQKEILFSMPVIEPLETTVIEDEMIYETTELPVKIGDVTYDAIYSILFGYNESYTSLTSDLDLLVTKLKSEPEKYVEIYGHTDSKGKLGYNYELAFQRIDFIETYLRNKGIAPTRMVSRSFGELKPVAPNELQGHDYSEGRRLNRRVELRVR